MTLKKNFKVISAGVFVAGQRSPGKGEIIQLTDKQAQYPLINGEIESEKPVSQPITSPAEKPALPASGKDKG